MEAQSHSIKHDPESVQSSSFELPTNPKKEQISSTLFLSIQVTSSIKIQGNKPRV